MHKLIVVGKIAKPHGFRGDLIVQADGGSESALAYLEEVFIGNGPQDSVLFKIEKCTWMPKGWKLKLTGIESDDAVKERRNQLVFGQRSALKATSENEFYIEDLVGAIVIDAQSLEPAGVLVGVEASPGADRWWVEHESHTYSIPSTKHFIHRVDANIRTIWVNHTQELLDLTKGDFGKTDSNVDNEKDEE